MNRSIFLISDEYLNRSFKSQWLVSQYSSKGIYFSFCFQEKVLYSQRFNEFDRYVL